MGVPWIAVKLTASWGRPPSPRVLVGLVVLALAVLAVAFELGKRPAEATAGSDIGVFETYGSRMLDGELPYRDFRMEYPPASALTFLLPATGVLAGGSAEGADWNPPNDPARRYYRGFTRLVLLLMAATVVLSALTLASMRRPAAGVLAALLFVALSPVLLERVLAERFDVWPAALSAAALAASVRERYRLGGALLGLATAAKIYPALLVPVVAVVAFRRRGIREAVLVALWAAGVAAVVVLPFAIASPSGVWESLRVQFRGGLQIESTASSLLVTSTHLLGWPVHSSLAAEGAGGGLIRFDLAGPGVGIARTLTSVLVVLALVAIWVGLLRSRGDPREDLLRYGAGTLATVLALGTVLSPQYLVWLVPVVPLVAGRRGILAALALAVALALTDAWIPERYLEYQDDLGAGPTSILLARNLALVALALVLVLPGGAFRSRASRRRRRAPRAPRASS